MINDPMKQSVYEAEREFWRGSMYRNDFPTAGSIARMIASVLETKAVSDLAPVAVKRLKPIVNGTFEETSQGLFVSNVMCSDRKFFLQLPHYSSASEFKCTSSMVGLKFPEHGRNAPIISHELAHLLRFLELGFSKYLLEEDHGREFQETYVAAVSGSDVAASRLLHSMLV